MSDLQLADMFDLIVKYFQRPIVLRQMLAVVIAIVLGTLLAGVLRRASALFYKRFILGDRWSSHGRRYRSFWRGMRELWIVAAGPLLIIILLVFSERFFNRLRWPYGVMTDTIRLVAIVLAIRLVVGLLEWLIGKRKVRPYRSRLIGPATALFVLLSVVSWFIPPRQLASLGLFESFEGMVTLGAVFLVTVGFYFVLQLLWAMQKIVIAITKRVTGVNQGALDAGLTILRYVLIGAFALGAARLLQLNTSTIAAVTGGLALGAGLALQDILSNFIGGVVVLFEGAVRPGDWIEVDGMSAQVEKLSIRSTIVRRSDNSRVIVPNQDWLNQKVTTYTRGDRSSAFRLSFTVPYETDLSVVKDLVKVILRESKLISHVPEPFVALKEFNQVGFEMFISATVPDYEDRGLAIGLLTQSLYEAFRANGIGFARPQQEVYLREYGAEQMHSIAGIRVSPLGDNGEDESGDSEEEVKKKSGVM